jgi:hypothetical protein
MRFARPLLFAIALLACKDAADSAETSAPPPCESSSPEEKEQCLSDHYFRGYEPATRDSCAGFSGAKEKIRGRREIAFFTSGSITDQDVVTEGQFLQRYYEAYDLTFFTTAPPTPSPISYGLNGSNAEMDAAIQNAGTDEDAQKRAVGDVMFGPLRDFIMSQSQPPSKRVNVVIVERVASPDVAKLFEGGVIGGLGLSPDLFKDIAANDPQKNLFDLIGLPAEFTPTLVIGHRDIVSLAKNPDMIVAHELGHSLGLQHQTEQGNLMTQGQSRFDCTPGLTTAQVEQLREAASTFTTRESWEPLFELRDRYLQRFKKGSN